MPGLCVLSVLSRIMGCLLHNDRLCQGPGVIKAAFSTPPGGLWVFGAEGGDGTRQGAEGSG